MQQEGTFTEQAAHPKLYNVFLHCDIDPRYIWRC